MKKNEIKEFFLENFNEFSKEFILKRDFYNLTKEDCYGIAKDTFNAIVRYYGIEVDENLADNIVLAFYTELV